MIYLFALRFYNFESRRINIGGTQTYFQNLSELFISRGYDVKILDIKKGNSIARKDSLGMIQVEEFKYQGNLNKCYHRFYHNVVSNNDFVIIGSDEYAIYPGNQKNVISIQHGIGWDIMRSASGKKRFSILFPLYKFKLNILRIKKFLKGSNYVCVDYNYYNWLKAVYEVPDNRIVRVIPNFTRINFSEEDINNKTYKLQSPTKAKIVFARRFQDFRGAIVWARVVCKLSKEYPELSFTFAGEGPCENEMRKILKGLTNVTFTHYNQEDSVQFHKQYDIAVIPTLFSEGTSLSACEAMAAGCYPIACHTGGLTNIIIDGHNGTLCYPSEESFYNAVKYVISMNISEFRETVFAAYETARDAFSKELWDARWIEYMKSINLLNHQ